MAYDPARHRRRSIRLAGYDYAAPGWYFVTICVHGRLPLLGTVTGDATRLTPAGAMAQAWWHHLPDKFLGLYLDAFVVMPDHIHGLLGLAPPPDPVRADPRVRPPARPTSPDRVRPPLLDPGAHAMPAPGAHTAAAPGACVGAEGTGAHVGAPLPRIVQWWKTMTTNAYIHGVRTDGWPRFDRRLWHRNYWERIVRTERELGNIRRYIHDNPRRWYLDRRRRRA